MKLDTIFLQFVPNKILKKYSQTWAEKPKATLAEFAEACSNSKHTNFYTDWQDIKEHYQGYLRGEVNLRYPEGILHPDRVLLKIMREANKQINLDNHEF